MRKSAILISPVFILSLAVLLLNDHGLKPLYPAAWITGKLSDFAGLIVFAGFIAVLLSRFVGARSAMMAGHVTAGLVLLAWKIGPVGSMLTSLQQWIPIGFQRVADPTDLLALFVLPASYCYFSHRMRLPGDGGTPHGLRRLTTGTVFVTALFSIVATSPPRYLEYKEVDYRPMDDVADDLIEFERLLAANGFQVKRRGTAGNGDIGYELRDFDRWIVGEHGDSLRVGAYGIWVSFESVADGLELDDYGVVSRGAADGGATHRYFRETIVDPWRSRRGSQ